MSYLNEPCGCSGDTDYQSVINTSPILSGSQEAAFSPDNNSFSFLEQNDNNIDNSLLTNYNKVKNNFSENNDSKKNYSIDDIIELSNSNKKSNNNIQDMNTTQPSFENINQQNNSMNINQLLNSPNINNRNSQNAATLPDSGMMRNNLPSDVNPQLQEIMNKIHLNQQPAPKQESNQNESDTRFILKNFNIVLMVILGLAWSDVAKFYINRSIKFGGGNHKYYIYYALIVSVVLYGTSKYISQLH